MATNNYFKEYFDFIDDLKNRIMIIQLRYNNCIEAIKRDMSSGVLDDFLGNRLLALRMDERLDNVDSKYCLSREDADFIRTYADLDNDGQVLNTFLKREYLDKHDRMLGILKAVRIFGYLDSVDPEQARLVVKQALVDYCSGEIKALEKQIKSFEDSYGEKAIHQSRYITLVNRKIELERGIRSFEQLLTADDEMLNKVVSQFYGVKRYYYDWFLKMEVKAGYESGVVYGQQCDLLRSVADSSKKAVEFSNQLVEENKKLETYNNSLFDVLRGLSSFNIDEIVPTPKKKRFGKVVLNNKDALFEAFVRLVTLDGVKGYIEETYGDEKHSVNLSVAFEQFFNGLYGVDTLYVESSTFLKDFKNKIIMYYKSKIGQIISKISELNAEITSRSSGICDNIGVAVKNADLQRDIREQYPAKQSELLLTGFSVSELDKMYSALKEFIGNGFSFDTDDEEIIFSRRV